MRPAHRHYCGSLGSGRAGSPRAFTLLELLVTVSIIALLIAILGTTLGQVREAGRDFVCKNKKKTVAFEFFQFADDYAHPWRGDSETLNGRFYLQDFIERSYSLNEFWKTKATPGLAYNASDHPLLCPSGPQELSRVNEHLPCSKAAFDRWSNISTAFNQRLNVRQRPGAPAYVSSPIELSNKIMKMGMAPLAFDADGRAAVDALPNENTDGPVYGTPSVEGEPSTFYKNRWHPAMRHLKRMNVAFVGGHVLSSSDPERETGWRWKYVPK